VTDGEIDAETDGETDGEIDGDVRWQGPPLGTLAVIGVGQIGGSAALAARAAGAVSAVVGWSRSAQTLRRAVELGIIDRAAPSAREAARDAAVILLATPTRSLGALAGEIAPALGNDALVMDAGSVKAAAVRAVEQALATNPAGGPVRFVGCHPLAGTERFGPDAATAELFVGRHCIVCPTARTPPALVERAERFWRALGARPYRMDAALHDRVMGAGSHLPHVAAYALAAAVGALDAEGGPASAALRALTTTSLRDTTRIAASSAVMWRDILLDNRADMLPLIDGLLAAIGDLRSAIAANDADTLERLLEAARTARAKILPP
jgi:prephenate dehydrogenase